MDAQAGTPVLDALVARSNRLGADRAHCFFEPGRPRPSIETLLHAFLPAAEVDHTHADATNFLACAADGERLARELFGDELIWIPYLRPGFRLSRQVALVVRDHPRARLVILAKHGLITWGESPEECFANTMETIARAHEFVQRRMEGRPAFGGLRCTILSPEERHRLISTVLPTLRGLLSGATRCILRYEDTPDVLTFAGSVDAPRLVTIGAACPDHLVHTKPWP